MKTALFLCLGMTLTAQELPGSITPPPAAPTAPVAGSVAPPATAPGAQLPPAEQRLRVGIILLQQLEQQMASINDEESAEAAVAPLMRLNSALPAWAQSFTALPPLSEQEQQAYEDEYLPLIRKLNNRIKLQAGRLAAAQYYHSLNLPAALAHLAMINQ